MRPRQKAKHWNSRWLKKSNELLPSEIDQRIELAYMDGFEAGQRHQRKAWQAKMAQAKGAA